ncbi:hypothetical protein QJ854_gp647 [Moumouvirus goulette]|uniref:Uncharacterized protein n=1 Tax=Moumouvirus goulette TaxID=1247379 RepID=M1NM79_9VIRU|nr:hypothetical protein QJ854_gp647 [Moumouvirus goulette]AGF85135.1 hypothetical protein glt_00326 [Moumouvirus goulette]
MERVQGFDLNNTSQYSSFDPVRGIENVGSNAYNFINSANPFPTLARDTSHLAGNARNVLDRTYHDVENVADRSFDTARNVADRSFDTARNVADRSFDDVRNVADRSFDDVRNVADRSFDDVRNFVRRTYDDLRQDVSDVNYSDFYASDTGNTALRDSMQSPYLNSYLDIKNPTNVLPIQSPPIVSNNSANDYNILFAIVILLVLFIAWRYWAM